MTAAKTLHKCVIHAMNWLAMGIGRVCVIGICNVTCSRLAVVEEYLEYPETIAEHVKLTAAQGFCMGNKSAEKILASSS